MSSTTCSSSTSIAKSGIRPTSERTRNLWKLPVGIAQHVVEEAVLLVPQLIVAAAHVLHRAADVDEVLEELRRHRLVGAVVVRQLQGDAHHVEAEQAHPAGRVGLLEDRAVRQPLAAVDDGDVVEAEEAAFEDVVPLAVDLVDPPREVDQQLVEAASRGTARSALPGARLLDVVHAPARPGMHRRIEVGELPLVRRDLAVGVLELLEQQQPELLLRELRIDERERDAVKREIPRGEPRDIPTCPASTARASS